MLDDLKIIHHRDKSDALGTVAKQWQQLQHDFSKVTVADADHIFNIVLAGMGGSALAAALAARIYAIQEPFEIVRDYDVPEYVDGDTLFIASSYSGNTEETLSALEQAQTKGATIAVIAAGGELARIAKKHGYPFYKLPEGIQPRMAAFYNLAALTQLLTSNGLIHDEAVAELREAGNWLATKMTTWLPDIATTKNQAKQLAQDCIGLSPVIYAGPLLYPAAYMWKISFNENAKNVAWCNQFSEFNHNEMAGWQSHPVDKPYKLICLRSSFDHPQIAKRFEISDKLLSGKWPHPTTVAAVGDTHLRQVLWTVALGDFVSIYTAILNNVDIASVAVQEKLKQELV